MDLPPLLVNAVFLAGIFVKVFVGKRKERMEVRDDNPSRIEDATKRAVEEIISAEIRSAAISKDNTISPCGHVSSHPFALTTFDTSSTLPAFLPLTGVTWPEAVKAVWKTFRANSTVGLFPELSRAWITIDNKLLLWNFGTGRDFFLFDEVPELIVAVGTPVLPIAGVFQAHITYVLPVSTPKAVHLLGLCVFGGGPLKKAELYVVSLGFSVMAPALFTKLVGVKELGRIFAAGADGCLYEVKYAKEDTAFLPKLRLVNCSLMFGSVPVLGAVSSLISAIKQTWAKERPALRDVAIEAKRKLLFTLNSESTISLWRITNDGLSQLATVRGGALGGTNRTSVWSGGAGVELARIFCATSSDDSCSLIAVAANGEQYRYVCQDGLWGGADASLSLRESLGSYIPQGREVTVCFASEGISVVCHAEKSEGGYSPDSVTVASSHKGILQPHHNCRDIVAQFEPEATCMTRVDAISEVPVEGGVSPNELCSQVSCSPRQFVFLHRHGVSTFIKLRPVDTLHMIIASSSEQVRDSLLQRLSSIYSASDYCCMLVQIAVGCTNVPVTVDGPYVERGDANASFSPAGKGNGKSQIPLSVEQLGRQLNETPSQEVQRIAREILRSAMAPSWYEGPGPDDGTRHIVVQVSPFASGVLAYISRALYAVWNTALEGVTMRELAVVETALSSVVRLLNSLKRDVWSDKFVQPAVPFQWDKGKVTLVLPPHRSSISSYDIKMLQSALLCSSHTLCERVLQTIKFLKQTAAVPPMAEDGKVTVAQIVSDQSVAHRMARHVGKVVLSSEKGAGYLPQDGVGSVMQLQLECPYFFNSIDVQEYNVRVELERLLSANGENFHAFPEGKMAEWESSVSIMAASLWYSGALLDICQQLRALKKEGTAVKLLLHAACQLDPNNSAFKTYLAEKSGNLNQAVSSAVGSTYQQKLKVLGEVVSTLENAWNTHRSTVDGLLGGPLSSGAIWQIEPTDELAHCYLFDWLCLPRDDAHIKAMLRETLVAAHSPFIEAYLQRNISTLGEQYVRYLRKTKKNHALAIEVCASVVHAPLTGIPREERISYRLRCLAEAKGSAEESKSDQLKSLEQRIGLMEAQLHLSKIICEFINSGHSHLDRRVAVDGRGLMTERQIALEQMEMVENHVLSTVQLLQVAGMFCAYGGAEVQLDVLNAANVTDSSLHAACIDRCFQRKDATVEEIARRVIGKCMRTIASPLCHVVKILEAYAFQRSPEGSTLTVDVLYDCGVEHNVIFSTIAAIFDKRDFLTAPCETFDQSAVTDAFLVHSLAAALHRAVFASHISSVQMYFLGNALNTVREGISKVAIQPGDERSIRALSAAGGRVCWSGMGW